MAMARAKGNDRGDASAPQESVGSPLGYEEARAALAAVVAELESGETTLEEALALWERGEEYARICEEWLAGAQQRISAQTDPQGHSQEAEAPPSS